MIVYTVTKVFGTDAIKTRVFNKKKDALEDIEKNIMLCSEDDSYVVEEKENEETYYILTPNETNASDYIEFVLRRCEIL